MKTRTITLTLSIFASLAISSQLCATEVLTTTLTPWEGTTTGSYSEWDFNIPSSSYSTASGYTLNVGSFGPVNVKGPNGAGYTLNKLTGYGSSNLIGLQGANNGVGSMVFTAPVAGLTAFGLGLGISGSTAPITVTLSDGEVFTVNPTVGSTVFLGLSSATAITSFTLTTSAGSSVDLVDFFAGPSNEPANAPAAEVATALMIGSGLLIFGARRKVFSNVSRFRADLKIGSEPCGESGQA